MANEEFYVTVLALVFLAVVVYVVASTRCKSRFTASASDNKVTITLITKKPLPGITDLVNEFSKTYPIETNPAFYITNSGDFLPVVIESKTFDLMPDRGVKIEFLDQNNKIIKTIVDDLQNPLWQTDIKSRTGTAFKKLSPSLMFQSLFDLLGLTVLNKPPPSIIDPPPPNTSDVGGIQKVVISLTTKKSFVGINDLIKEFKKTSTYYMDPSNRYVPVEVEAKIDASLNDKAVVFTSSLDPKNPKTFTDRSTKKSMWNTDRKANVRVLEFLKFINFRTLPKPISFTPGKDVSKTEYNYYIITKTENRSVLMLVDALNTIVQIYQFTKMTDKVNKVNQTLPLRFYAGTMKTALPDMISFYENTNKTMIPDKTISLVGGEFSKNPTDITKFNQLTDFLPGYDTLVNCPSSNLPDTRYPNTIDVCDELTNHCYLLRTNVNRSHPGKCSMAPGRVKAVVNAYNEAMEQSGLRNKYTSKPVRFYGAVVVGKANETIVSASIDDPNMVIFEPNILIDTSIKNNDFTHMKNRAIDYIRTHRS